MTDHICMPTKQKNGSFKMRLSGDFPIDCGTCNIAMSLQEFMENELRLNTEDWCDCGQCKWCLNLPMEI